MFGIAGLVVTAVFELTNHNFSSAEGVLRSWEGSRAVLALLILYSYLLFFSARTLRMSVAQVGAGSVMWASISRTQVLQGVVFGGTGLIFCLTTLPTLYAIGGGTPSVAATGGVSETAQAALPYPSTLLILARVYFIAQPCTLILLAGSGCTLQWAVPPSLTHSFMGTGSTHVLHSLPIMACVSTILSHETGGYYWRYQYGCKAYWWHELLHPPRRIYLETLRTAFKLRGTLTPMNYGGYDLGHLYYRRAQFCHKPLIAGFLHASLDRSLFHQIMEGYLSRSRSRSVTLLCSDYGRVGIVGIAGLCVAAALVGRNRSAAY
jgi:hypothetical protein